jgi:4-hydroxy-4-methyl-2-oxoglutarate aldolase
MKPTIVRNVPRADAEVIRTLGQLGVATVHEAQGRTGLMRPFMRPIYPAARAHGAVGLIIDAGIRDVADLTTMEFPVWAKAISAQGTVKATAGSVNVPIVAAGAPVNPGDVIVADIDGVVVVRREAAGEIARLGTERVAKEEKAREKLRNGELGLDFYGLRAKLTELGAQWKDE